MDTSPPQATRTVITLVVATLVFIGMGYFGVTQAIKPLPTFDADDEGSRCSESEITRTTEVTREDVTVSVYNAGARRGFAGLTQERLERAGFRPGALGNAPEGEEREHSVVYTTSDELAPARLVAAALGKNATVEQTNEDYGPGVDVFVGSKQRRLAKKAPQKMDLDTPVETCVPVD